MNVFSDSNLFKCVHDWNCEHGEPYYLPISEIQNHFKGVSQEKIRERLKVLIDDAKWMVENSPSRYKLTEEGLVEVSRL
jgi:hypothetical protein